MVRKYNYNGDFVLQYIGVNNSETRVRITSPWTDFHESNSWADESRHSLSQLSYLYEAYKQNGHIVTYTALYYTVV